MLKKIILRILSFALDLGLTSLIILGISMLSFVNPESNELNRMYKAYYKSSERYVNLTKDINVYFEDEVISSEEEGEILAFYSEYYDCFKDIVVDEKITTGDQEKIKENIEKTNTSITNEQVISINKIKYRDTFVSLIVFVLYFGVLQYLLHGQTPFKRLFRIRVVDKDDEKRQVSLVSFLVRAMLVTEIIISLTDLVLLFKLTSDNYIAVNYWLTQGKYIYEMAFLVCMIIRDDNRSIHDLLLNTRVLRYDRDGREIVEQLFSDEDEEDTNKTN